MLADRLRWRFADADAFHPQRPVGHPVLALRWLILL
jgi:hypothetical protein